MAQRCNPVVLLLGFGNDGEADLFSDIIHFLTFSNPHRHSYIGVNCPAIVREIPHVDVFPAFSHFPENIPHFWLYIEKTLPETRDNFLAPGRNFVHNFTINGFRLYDENRSSKGRFPWLTLTKRARCLNDACVDPELLRLSTVVVSKDITSW